jgi:hypothetical protein
LQASPPPSKSAQEIAQQMDSEIDRFKAQGEKKPDLFNLFRST